MNILYVKEVYFPSQLNCQEATWKDVCCFLFRLVLVHPLKYTAGQLVKTQKTSGLRYVMLLVTSANSSTEKQRLREAINHYSQSRGRQTVRKEETSSLMTNSVIDRKCALLVFA